MKTYQLVIISVMLHLWLYSMALLIPSVFPKKPSAQEIEVVYQNETDNKKSGHFFEDYSPKEEEKLDILKKTVQRLSRVTRRVEEEMQARREARSQNSNPSQIKNLRDQLLDDLIPKKPTAVKKESETEQSAADTPSINKASPDRVATNTQLSDSSISNYIPDVRMGGFSSLNSDQFVFYTFYARTNEQIRNRWIDNIRRFLSTTAQTEINRLASRAQNSQVEIILDRGGHFVKALMHQRSENNDLDESAISAFRLASPLNNPPEEMVEEDGFIHLHYVFTLYFKPSYIASGSR